MKILVTGGNGFIGYHVLRHLVRSGVEVVCFDLRTPPAHFGHLLERVRLEIGDVLNPLDIIRVIKNESIGRIVHLAGIGKVASQKNPGLCYQLNIMGSRNILEAARILGVERVVFASSASVYGNVSEEWLTEDAPKNPISVYGMAKLAVEHLGFTYSENWGLDFVAIRPCLGLGPYRTGGSLMKLTQLVQDALRGVPATMREDDRTYEMLHTSDTGKAFAVAAVKDTVTHKVFQVGMGRRITMSEIVGIVREEIPGARIQIEEVRGRAGADQTRTDQPPMELTRARQEGWLPDYTLEAAVKDVVDHLR